MYETQPVLDGKGLSTESLVYQNLHDWKERYDLILRDFSNILAYVEAKNIFWRICPRVRPTLFPQNMTMCKSDT